MRRTTPPSAARPAPPAAALAALAALTLAALAAAPAPAVAQEASAADLAVLPIPLDSERAAATVIRKGADGWTTLREGSGTFICIADDPAVDGFHAACYHESLEPYMARGRELTAEGVAGRPNVERRMAEIEAGTLEMPPYGMLHQIFAGDDWAGDLEAADRHFSVIYAPFATAESTGLPTRATRGAWLMGAGTANAHIMITP